MADEEELALGIDVGGTKVAAGAVTARGEILRQARVPMVTQGTAQEGLAAVLAAVDALGPGAEFSAIGIVAPGPLDPRAGVILNPPNVPCWRNFPLAQHVRDHTGLAVRLDNDANAAGLAEARWGAGQGYACVFYATLGTGIGTGLTFGQNGNSRIYHGRTGAAAEAGHITIDYRGPQCGCGKRGCIEALAAGPAIARRAQEFAAQQRSGALLRLAAGDVRNITAEMVADAYRAGDPIATEALRQTAELLGIWLGCVIDVLEPDVIVIGGGLSQLMSAFFPLIGEQAVRWCMNPRAGEIPLVRARYGADAGIAGAAALCFT